MLLEERSSEAEKIEVTLMIYPLTLIV